MITRVVEYVIRCDNDECVDRQTFAYGWHSRAEAEERAMQMGYVPCTRKRWICKRCAEKLNINQTNPRGPT